MRLCLILALLVTLQAVIVAAGAARASRGSRSSYRSSRSSSGYSSSRYSYRGPVFTRRLSPSLMGPLYFSYAIRYPSHFSYRRTYNHAVGVGETCMNYLALSNGSYVGSFSCPFLPDEPGNWTRCCGYVREEFCCDPSYDDSWKHEKFNIALFVLIVSGCIGSGFLLLLFWLGLRRRRFAAVGRVNNATAGDAANAQTPPIAAASAAEAEEVKPIEGFSKQSRVVGSCPLQQPPPYSAIGFTPDGRPLQGATVGIVNQGFEMPPYPLPCMQQPPQNY